MNGKVAKRIRRKVLGSGYSTKATREYKTDSRTGQVIVQGKRADYQKAKAEYNQG